MRIFLVGSKNAYAHIAVLREALERRGHVVTLPNNFDDPSREQLMKDRGEAVYRSWKADMLRLQAEKVAANDAVLVANLEKNGQPNYLGGATSSKCSRPGSSGRRSSS